MTEITEPVCTGINIQTNRGGKIAIVEFGKINSGWGISMSRQYAIPPDWTDEQVSEFQLAKYHELEELIAPLDQAEYDIRYENREWE